MMNLVFAGDLAEARHRHLIVFVLLVLAVAAFAPRAADATDTNDFSIIRVHGNVQGGGARVGVEDIRGWGVETIKTSTPFTDGESVFVGVPFQRFWENIEPLGSSFLAIAANDYNIEVQAGDLIAMEAFVAFEQDGRRLGLRDKGPFWIVFPWSRRPELKAAGVYSLSIWQLVEIEVL